MDVSGWRAVDLERTTARANALSPEYSTTYSAPSLFTTADSGTHGDLFFSTNWADWVQPKKIDRTTPAMSVFIIL
jgi:hypothetical protein